MKATEIHNIVRTAWPDDCLSLRRIQTICLEFENGERDDFKRKPDSGREKSQLRIAIVEEVQRLLDEDPSTTIQRIYLTPWRSAL